MCATVSPERPVSPVRPVGPTSPVTPVWQAGYWWTPQKIDWYVRASKCSDFHEKIACEIAGMVPREKSVLEVGCGLGYITSQLSQMGYDVFGIDIDEEVIEKAQELHGSPASKRIKPIGKQHTGNQQSLFGLEDYRTSHRMANVVLAVFCGRIEEEGLGTFERLATERIIYIVSQHKSNNLKRDRTAEICTYLEKSGHHFTFKELSLRFDQPFTSQEEAAIFLELQHGNVNLPVKRSKGPYKDQYPYVFENEKKMSIFVIDI